MLVWQRWLARGAPLFLTWTWLTLFPKSPRPTPVTTELC